MWFFVILLILALAAVVAAAAFGARGSFPARTAAVVLAVALLATGAALFWKHTVIAIAIASVCSLAVGVMFTRIDPGKAFAGALAAFVLMFAGPWLALQMAEPLLFERESDLSRWFDGATGGGPFGEGALPHPGFFVAVAVASLLAACFLGRGMKALAVFGGSLLLLLFGPRLLDDNGFFLSDFFHHHDPAVRLVVVALIVLGVVGIVRLLATSTSNHKNP